MDRATHAPTRRSAPRAVLAATVLTATACVASALADETPLVFAQPVYESFAAPFFPTTLRARDLDGDGRVDLVVPGRDPDHRLFTMRGLGDGRFVPFQELAVESFVDAVELGDLDGDGREDLVAVWKGDRPRLVLHRGLEGGLFAKAEPVADLARDPQWIALADFDGDGDLDVATTAYISAECEIHFNDGTGAVSRVSRVGLGRFLGGYAYPRMVHAADLDGDGDADLVINEVGGSRVAVLRNETGAAGAGRFVRATEYRAPLIGDERPGISSLVVADVDGDGDLDAVVPALLLNGAQKTVAFINDGTGRFVDRLVGDGAPLGYAFSLALADLDGDGDLDAATGAALPGLVSVARRTSDGVFTFANDSLLPFGQLVRDLIAVDVDGDCDLDIVGVDGPARAVFTCLNLTPGAACDGGVAGERRATTGRAPRADVVAPEPQPAPDIGDLDGDGVRGASDLAVWLVGRSRPAVETPDARTSDARSPGVHPPIDAKGAPR
ncbi:MAG: hypothetical protein RIS86_1685 [Planctomycetota bacterium]